MSINLLCKPSFCALWLGVDGSRYVPSPGSPGFYANQSTAAVTIDQHSLMLDRKRIMVFA